MREILFRGAQKVDCAKSLVWYEGSLIIETDDYTGEKEYYIQNENGSFLVIPETVGQYTGLPDDENGMKIFEGDILRVIVNGNTTICKVAFAENVAQFQLWQTITLPKTSTALNLGNYECEVIGNIHDNPELLKEADNE